MADFGRRSNRSRKTIDYSKLDSVGSDDDDFKNLSPPTKRQKQKNEGHIKKMEKMPKKENLKEIPTHAMPTVKSKERVPVTEKVFERHLQVALQLSATTEKSGPEEAKATREEDEPNEEKQLEVPASKSLAPLLQEQIENEKDSDKDFNSDASDWSDTEKNSKSKLKKNEKTIAKSKQSVEKQLMVQTTRVRQQTKVHHERTISPKPPQPSSPITLPGGTVKTPSTGLRLGLSRKVVSKPLHPVVKVRH